MATINDMFRYIGYIALSIFIGYVSFLGGEEHDYLLKISGNLVPVLISLLVFYVTIFGLILKELVIYKNKTNKAIDGVLKNIKKEVIIEICIIILTLLCFIARGACTAFSSGMFFSYIAILSNAITVFAVIYFLLVIYDSILGLWKLLAANN